MIARSNILSMLRYFGRGSSIRVFWSTKSYFEAGARTMAIKGVASRRFFPIHPPAPLSSASYAVLVKRSLGSHS